MKKIKLDSTRAESKSERRIGQPVPWDSVAHCDTHGSFLEKAAVSRGCTSVQHVSAGAQVLASALKTKPHFGRRNYHRTAAGFQKKAQVHWRRPRMRRTRIQLSKFGCVSVEGFCNSFYFLRANRCDNWHWTATVTQPCVQAVWNRHHMRAHKQKSMSSLNAPIAKSSIQGSAGEGV